MAVTIQIKRGTQTQINSGSLSISELAFATDTKNVYVGDGVGKILVGRAGVDTLANRPTAGVSGRFFWATDNSTLYLDDGSSWNSVSGSGSSTFSEEITDFSPDDTSPAQSRSTGPLQVTYFPGDADSIAYFQFVLDSGVDFGSDIKFDVTFCMSSAETSKEVSLNADYWVFADGDSPTKSADSTDLEDELTVPDDGTVDIQTLSTIKIASSDISAAGQIVAVKLWRDVDGVTSNHTGDFQIISVRAYQT